MAGQVPHIMEDFLFIGVEALNHADEPQIHTILVVEALDPRLASQGLWNMTKKPIGAAVRFTDNVCHD
jgi:hypothetical protein